MRLKRLTDIDRDLRVVQWTLFIVCINMKNLGTVSYAAFLRSVIPSVHERLLSSIFKRTFESWKKSRDARVVTNGSGLVVSTRDGCSKEECHLCCLLMTAAIAHLFKGWHPGGTSDVKWISIELVCDAYVVQKCCLFFPKKIQHVSQELSSTSVDRNFWKTSCLIQQANFITEKWITCFVNSWSFSSRESSLFLLN